MTGARRERSEKFISFTRNRHLHQPDKIRIGLFAAGQNGGFAAVEREGRVVKGRAAAARFFDEEHSGGVVPEAQRLLKEQSLELFTTNERKQNPFCEAVNRSSGTFGDRISCRLHS